MWIDSNNNVIKRPKSMVTDKVTYSKEIFNDEEKLNSLGIFRLTEDLIPDRRYYSYEESINYSTRNIDRLKVEKPLESIKARILKNISKSFKSVSKRPIVDTGLGFSIDCGIDDIKRLEIGKEMNTSIIVDSDGVPHISSPEMYSTILFKMKARGLELYQQKWSKEEEIRNMDTIKDIMMYERYPIAYESASLDENLKPCLDVNGNPILEKKIKYIDKATIWN